MERGLAGLPTSFRADAGDGSARPRAALLCEYDALPGIGHACGHSIIAAASAGADAALEGATLLALTALRVLRDGKLFGRIKKEAGVPVLLAVDSERLFYLSFRCFRYSTIRPISSSVTSPS